MLRSRFNVEEREVIKIRIRAKGSLKTYRINNNTLQPFQINFNKKPNLITLI
jgi:hypothetical protein